MVPGDYRGIREVIVSKKGPINYEPTRLFIMAALSAKPLESKIAPSLLACDLSDMAGEAARVTVGVEIKFARWRRIFRLTG